jgi:hypothetical protein
MKTSTKISALVLVFGLGVTGCSSSANPATTPPSASAITEVPATGANPEASSPEVPSEAPTAAEISQMSDAEIAWEALMGVDGEYAAAASYQAVIDEYGPVEPYTTILEAENRHINALIRQLESMGVDVPENPYLGKISAPADLTAAAKAWAEGEVLNVEMYDRLLAEVDGDSLTRVLTNLRRSSLESHLPSFELAADNGGVLSADQMASH